MAEPGSQDSAALVGKPESVEPAPSNAETLKSSPSKLQLEAMKDEFAEQDSIKVPGEKAPPELEIEKEIIEAKKPEYLDEAFINIRVCCPAFMFKYCPCCLCSCFSVLAACMVNCAISICKLPLLLCSSFKTCALSICSSFKTCALSICTSFKTCALSICKLPLLLCKICAPCLKLGKCFMGCALKICAPCLKLGTCFMGCALKICAPCLKLGKCLSCNASCGLPCRNPPGCVCIFPFKMCGFGLTCPYFCISCGTKHCFKMPKEERQYWHEMREIRAKNATKEELKALKAEEIDMDDIEALRKAYKALQADFETLKKQNGQTSTKE